MRQLSNVRAAPQVTTLKALLLPTPKCFTQFPGLITGGAQLIRWLQVPKREDRLVAIDIGDQEDAVVFRRIAKNAD